MDVRDDALTPSLCPSVDTSKHSPVEPSISRYSSMHVISEILGIFFG